MNRVMNRPTNRLMNRPTGLARAVRGMALLSLACAATTVLRGELDLRIRGWGLVVTLVLAVLAGLVGLLGRHRLALLPGIGFLAAAVLQIAQLGGEAGAIESGVLGGNATTFGVWLGLGIGLTVLGLAREPAGPDRA